MRKLITTAAASCLALAFALPAWAQETSMQAYAEAAPRFIEVNQLDIAPADADAFLALVKQVKDAAVAVGLDPKFRWDTYRWDNTIYFVSWHESMGDFDNPEAFAQAFAGTAQEATVQQAMTKSQSMNIVGKTEVAMYQWDWSYLPENPAFQPGQHGGIYVIDNWIAPGKLEAWAENTKGVMEMLAQMDGPYPVIATQTMMGDGRVSFVIPFDNMSNFYGANSLQEGLAASGMQEQWGAHMQKRSPLLSKTKSQFAWYLPEHSYRPDLAMASGDGN